MPVAVSRAAPRAPCLGRVSKDPRSDRIAFAGAGRGARPSRDAGRTESRPQGPGSARGVPDRRSQRRRPAWMTQAPPWRDWPTILLKSRIFEAGSYRPRATQVECPRSDAAMAALPLISLERSRPKATIRNHLCGRSLFRWATTRCTGKREGGGKRVDGGRRWSFSSKSSSEIPGTRPLWWKWRISSSSRGITRRRAHLYCRLRVAFHTMRP